MYTYRLLTAHLESMARAFPAVIVAGARQVGKTTLLRHTFPDYDYVVFDPTSDIENARREPDLFLRNHPPPLILDEIQYAPELVSAIKRQIDNNGAAPGQYLLTGSQQWQVLGSIVESLAGRAVFLDLRGFSLHEIDGGTTLPWLARWLAAPDDFIAWSKQAARYPGNLQEWLWRGTLPKVWSLDESLVPDFWAGYQRTYIERDARLAGSINDWQEFGRFIRLMSALTAQEINHSQLGREIGMVPQTARRWLKILEATYQWSELPGFSGNPVKRVSQRAKGHFFDTGLACYHAGIASPRSLGAHPLFGALFETALINDIAKQADTLPMRPAFSHWRSAGGAEVDLLLEHDGTLYPIEIKLTANPGKRHASGIAAFRAAHSARRIAPGLVLGAIDEARWLADGVVAMPWNLLGTRPPPAPTKENPKVSPPPSVN